MDGIRYEFVTELPAEAVVNLYREGGWWDERWSRKAIPAMIRGSFAFLVARDAAGAAVGMGRAISDGASDAYIQDVVVHRALRGRGIGAEIVRRLTAHCRSRGLDWIGLVAEPGTEAFYERLGFHARPGYQLMLHEGDCD
ncbi:MAG TPA: GNAT family N-acetyltransferase [Acidobacteriota bacterium]|nr:GNAT family N-acetyltransferase [Acidobacteriota bacterium]HQM64860.1 GNAT family N-acetyltransferase [Acidobacteriota bacterium]